MIGPAIFAALTSDAAVTALVGAKVFPGLAPQGTPGPYLIFSVPSDTEQSTLDEDGNTRLSNARVQVDSYGDEYMDAQTLADAVEAVFKAMKAPAPGLSAWTAGRQDLYDNEAQKHRVQADFNVWR